MATTLKIPSKTGTDNFNLQDFIDDFNTIKTALDSLIAGNGIIDKGIVKAKLEQTVQDTLNVVPNNTVLIGQAMPSGAVLPFAMNVAPTGWLKCDGQVVSRTTYANLFTAIGTTYGAGDGSTTFKLPDLRGEFIRGFDDGKGTDTGRIIGSLQADDFKAHTHAVPVHNSTAESSGYGLTASGIFTNRVLVDSPTFVVSPNTSSTGGTETRPRNIALLYCIKC